jgi:Tfp pilus assembly protein PilE
MMSGVLNNRFTQVTVELAICSICVAILFGLYRNPIPVPRGKANASANADLRNAATAQEAYFVDHGTYCEDVNTLLGNVYGLYLSDGVTLTIIESSPTSYTMTTYHKHGSKTYTITGPGGSVTYKERARQ